MYHVRGRGRRLGGVMLCALGCLLATPVVGRAGGLPIPVLTAIMVEDEAANGLTIGRMVGVDPASPLQFGSYVDPAGASFFYATNAGQTYLGQSLTLSSSAVYNSSSGTMLMSGAGSYGSTTWSDTGKQTITQDPISGIWTIKSDYNDYDANGNKIGDLHIEVYLNKELTLSIDTAYFTDKYGNKIPNAQYASRDVYDEHTGNWDIEVYPVRPPSTYPYLLAVHSSGNSPGAGGSGTFTMGISATPEPSTLGLALVGGGCMLLAATSRRRRLRATTTPAA